GSSDRFCGDQNFATADSVALASGLFRYSSGARWKNAIQSAVNASKSTNASTRRPVLLSGGNPQIAKRRTIMSMRFRSSRLLSPLILCLVLLSPLGALAQDIERMDEIVRAQSDGMRFMGSVLVSRGGETLFERSYGYANLEW